MNAASTLPDCMRKYPIAFSLCLLPATAIPSAGPAMLFAPDGYRIGDFRSPVPESVPGGRTVSTAEVKDLIESAETAPVLIDVLPRAPRPQQLSPTALWLPPERYNIPGTEWLPNVGYGRLSESLDGYFRRHLQRLTGGDMARPVILYCQADCWMSWNAARRAAQYGYSNVIWYPDGTDGWADAQLPMALSTPVPMN